MSKNDMAPCERCEDKGLHGIMGLCPRCGKVAGSPPYAVEQLMTKASEQSLGEPVEVDERAEFEAWGADQGYFNLKREHSGKYKFQTAWAAWEGWQARAALERKP